MKWTQNRGMNLIELTITLAIVAILTFAAIPAISHMMADTKRTIQQTEIRRLFNTARITAIKSQTNVVVCVLNAQKACSKHWNGDLTLFFDLNNNRKVTQASQIIRIWQPTLNGDNMQWTRKTGYTLFRKGTGRNTHNGSLSYCDIDSPEHNFSVVISRTGRVRVDNSGMKCR